MSCDRCREGIFTCRCGTEHECGYCASAAAIPERPTTDAEKYAEKERRWILQRAIDAAVELSDLLATAKDAPALVAECNRFLAMAGYALNSTDVADRIRAVGELLAGNGCDCACDHSQEEHDDDCARCLACRIDATLWRTEK